jgi:hypothetical protein
MRKLAFIALVGALTVALTAPAAAVTDPDIGYITLDDTTTSLHYYDAQTTPQAWAWGTTNEDFWELTVATSCHALVHIEWFDYYPTNDIYELWVDGVSQGTNPAGGTGQADVWLAPGDYSIVVDWLYYQTTQPPIGGGSWYDITFDVTDQDCMPTGAITSPGDGEILLVGDTLLLGATYSDDDPGGVQWAVRKGTCAAGTNTVGGNVDGYNDPYSWDGATFSASFDTTGWAVGGYCFIFNPREDGIEPNMRLTREFRIADGMINGGGQIHEGSGPRKLKISFGGWLYRFGSAYECTWQINFHNVGDDAFDGGNFHAESCGNLNDYSPGDPPVDGVLNFEAYGTYNGGSGYKVIFRMEDAGEPGAMDTLRIQLYHGPTEVYDTSDGDFTDESNNFGTNRTFLDKGNIQIDMR